MNQSISYKPYPFFINTFLISWSFWLIAAYISYHPYLSFLLFPCILGGMSSPTLSALIMLYKSKDTSLKNRFFEQLRISNIKMPYLFFTLLCMPFIVLTATAISLLFGGSTSQFIMSAQVPDQALNGMFFIAIVATVILSCSLEEIGWRGYGIDSLKTKFNFLTTSLIFASLWSAWHLPLFLIKNSYYQQELYSNGIMFVVSYFVCLFPITILINWLYEKNNQSILIAILFHAILNISLVIFPIELCTKIIITLLLLLVAGIITFKER